MAVNAFCEGLRDRGVAPLVATQATNSTASVVRIAVEYLVAVEDVQEKRVIARVDWSPMSVLEAKTAEDVVGTRFL